MPKNNLTKVLMLKALGIAVCVIPPLCAILSYFPIWVKREGACMLSGFALLLVTLAFIPFYKQVIRILKSPSAYMMWLIVFILFLLLSRIADEMTVISFVGFISNLIGAVILKLAEREERKADKHE